MKQETNYLFTTVTEIKELVTVLVTLNGKLKKRVSELELQKVSLEREKGELEEKLNVLEERYTALKLGRFLDSDERKSAEKQIDTLVREIDQCIVLIQDLQ